MLATRVSCRVPCTRPKRVEQAQSCHTSSCPPPSWHGHRYKIPHDDPRLNHPIHQRPSFYQLWAALIFNRSPPPLRGRPAERGPAETIDPVLPSETQSAYAEVSADSLEPSRHAQPWTIDGAYDIVSRDVRESAEQYWRETFFGSLDEKSSEATAAAELAEKHAEIQAQVDNFIDDGDDSVEDKIVKERTLRRSMEGSTVMGRVANVINPLAAVLGPVQKILATVVVK